MTHIVNKIRGQNRECEGSALIVALLVMGVLITLTLGMSSLVIKELRQTSDTITAGKAYYAAEAGIENAMYDLSRSLPGYETTDPDNVQPGWVEKDENGLSYRYIIENKGDKIPYFNDNEPVFLTERGAVTKEFLYEDPDLMENTYNVLPLNGTVTIPLFTDNGDGTFTDVTDFLIEYYVDFKLDEANVQYQNYGLKLEDFDVLRWKIFGNPKLATNGLGRTESISDFYPSATGNRADNPVCIGTDRTVDNEISCITPVAYEVKSGSVTSKLDESWSYARECYGTDAGFGIGGAVFSDEDTGAPLIQKQCTIKNFITSHTRNYLTLTNIVNPEIIGISNVELRNARANIYYRIVAASKQGDPKLVRQFATVKADGFARNGQVKQSIDAKIGLSSFLPVFNFSLYRTDTSKPLQLIDAAKNLDIFGKLAL